VTLAGTSITTLAASCSVHLAGFQTELKKENIVIVDAQFLHDYSEFAALRAAPSVTVVVGPIMPGEGSPGMPRMPGAYPGLFRQASDGDAALISWWPRGSRPEGGRERRARLRVTFVAACRIDDE